VRIARRVVALAAAALILFGGAARALRPSVNMDGDGAWCDGIDDGIDDDSTDQSASAVVEDDNTDDDSRTDTRVRWPVSDDALRAREVRRACEAGDEVPRVASWHFRSLLHVVELPVPRALDPD